jgi:hypothetical protein
MARFPRSSLRFLFLPLVLCALAAACGSSPDNSIFVPHGLDAGGDGTAYDSGTLGEGGFIHGDGSGSSSGGGGDSSAGFDVEPDTLQTVTVTLGQPIPTVVFKATDQGQPVTAGWSVDAGNLASITGGASTSGTVTPTGNGGGLVTVTAGRNGVTLQRQVFIKIVASQNGPNNNPGEVAQIPTTTGQLTSGGGVGGVGGEGLGPPVTDQPTLTALGSPSSNGQAQGLSYLYPYDATVWPRGLLAPLLQWTWSTGDADAIEIKLATTSGSYTWTGTFGRPAILMQTGGKYIRAPIPQDVWAMATGTAGGPLPNGMTDKLTVSLVVAKSGVGYGPIGETWTVAPGLLDGIIYYNSYGTQLVQNSTGAVGGNGSFGAAVLSIHVGDTGPKLVAGANGGSAQCRVCHSVAAGGSALVAQHGDNYAEPSAYELTPAGAMENVLTGVSIPWFPGLYPDGSKMVTAGAQLLSLPAGTALPTSGLPGDPETPMFSPDGTLVAFNDGVGAKLSVMTFANASGAFSGSTVVVDDTNNAGMTPAWPAFFPDSKSLVFHHQSNPGIDTAGTDPCTRGGALAQIAWTSATDATHIAPLNQLNGKGYLPQLATPTGVACSADGNAVGGIDANHADDVDHNYEPTVNPLPAGGYVWVVFTSRRMYGSVADIPPFCSDPRGVDLITNITPKKLWVAAVDVNGTLGTDASHPAFYLPGQELLAGNSRAFWVLDPCLANGASCTAGDQCCDGYCEQGDGGGLVCGNKPPNATCSPQGDACTSSADCCQTNDACIDGFCEQSTAQ